MAGANRTGAEEKDRLDIAVIHGTIGRFKKGARKDEVVNVQRLLVAFERLRETSIIGDMGGLEPAKRPPAQKLRRSLNQSRERG